MTRPQPQRAGMERAQFAVEQKLIKLVGYAPTTGRLWWKAKPSRNTLIGRTIGRKCNKWGHLSFHAAGRTWMTHRVAWFLSYGVWPTHQIDHRNGDPSDNRLANLRDVPQSVNMQNQRNGHKGSASGLLGVHLSGEGKINPWEASIKWNGKRIYLGNFETATEAHAAYLTAKKRVHVPA